jgi:hypothetical protein
MAGLDCHRKLWQLLWDRESAGPDDGMAKLNKEFGKRFGELAHVLFPDAVLIDIDIFKLARAVEDTTRAIKDGAEVILEAAFCHEHCRVLADVVERQGDGTWHLIEVKSSARVKKEHFPDLAYQKWVMEQSGYAVSRCSVIHANKEGVWPNQSAIFAQVDVTEEVNAIVDLVEDNVAAMVPHAQSGSKAPDARALYSRKCHECNFKKTVCWQGIEGFTIYDVVNAPKIPALKAKDVLYLKDVPDDYTLSDAIRANVDRINNERTDIDQPAVNEMLSELEYPIYFLDFETVSVPIPLFNGNHPWEKLPFQYSLHVMDKGGELQHFEYLHEGSSDPSEEVAKRLVNQIGKKGSVVVYHARMEREVLQYLANRFPQFADSLNNMVDRIWDLEIMFKDHYRDWRFGSKSSLKVVLPNLIPELPYEELEIQEGGDASWKWIEILESDDADFKRAKADALIKYCERDTEAMVELLKFVMNIS